MAASSSVLVASSTTAAASSITDLRGTFCFRLFFLLEAAIPQTTKAETKFLEGARPLDSTLCH
eukprot:553585-Amphidinium_carterae.1